MISFVIDSASSSSPVILFIVAIVYESTVVECDFTFPDISTSTFISARIAVFYSKVLDS